MTERLVVAVVGGRRSELAAGYFLRRTGLRVAILDDGAEPGGDWPQACDSLTLLSPAQWSSLPGWPLPPAPDGGYPSRDAAAAYLTAYEARYALPVAGPFA